MNALFRKTGAIAAICLLHCGSADARLHDRYRSHDFYPHCCRPYPHRILVAPVRPAIALRISNRFDRKGRLEMALAYLRQNPSLSVGKYVKMTGLSKDTAEAELDAFAFDPDNPITLTVTERKKKTYTLQ